MKIEFPELIFFGLAALFVIEQIFYWFLGSYPYRHGLLLKTIPINDSSIFKDYLKQKHPGHLTIKENNKNGEMYLKDRYPFSIIGPLLFVGQIRPGDKNKLLVRTGPISTLFILYLIGWAFIAGDSFEISSAWLLVALIVFLFLRFYRAIQSVSPSLKINK